MTRIERFLFWITIPLFWIFLVSLLCGETDQNWANPIGSYADEHRNDINSRDYKAARFQVRSSGTALVSLGFVRGDK